MKQVTPIMRISLIACLLVGSAVYALLVSKDSELARTIMLGYIGLVLTIFLLVEIWKRPPHDR